MYPIIELANFLHSEMCNNVSTGLECKRYVPKNPHHDFYLTRAENIVRGLDRYVEPDELLEVVRIVVEESSP